MPSEDYIKKVADAKLYGTGIVGLWKKGWHRIPEVMASTPFAFIGAAIMFYVWKLDHEKNKTNPTQRFKNFYTIYRPEDRMTRWVEGHIHPNSPPRTSTPSGFTTTKDASCKSEFKF